MIRSLIVAAAWLIPTAAAAQTQQEELDARYDRALAAGYKALFLCSAIANAERAGTTRTPESIHEWELTGIQAPLDDIVRDLQYRIVRRPSGQVAHVTVLYDEAMPPRIAKAKSPSEGCSIQPIGTQIEWGEEPASIPPPPTIVPARLPPSNRYDPYLLPGDPIVDVQSAFTARYGEGRTTAVVVLKDGALVAEAYAEGFTKDTPQRTWSVAKSIAATLIGVAAERDGLDVMASAGLGANADDPRRAITIDHALRMASGRYSDTPGNRTDPLYWGGTTVEERAQNWPLIAAPGTVYRYANNDTLAAIEAAEIIKSNDIMGRPLMLLFARIGMFKTIAETDWQGNYVLSSQVWSTARDLGRIGQLYLNEGEWDGQRILPESWVDYVSTPSGPQPEGTNWGYGAGWWTFRRPEGNAFEGIPDDAFAARGNRGQYIVVVPSRNVVIVRRGEDMVGTRFDIAAFTRDVLAALET